MGMDQVGAVRLGGVREESRIELGRLGVPLLFWILRRVAIVWRGWRRDRGDVELGVVGRGVAGLGGGRGRKLPVEARRVPNGRVGEIGGDGWGGGGLGHARGDGDAGLLGRVHMVDAAACAISTKVSKMG